MTGNRILYLAGGVVATVGAVLAHFNLTDIAIALVAFGLAL